MPPADVDRSVPIAYAGPEVNPSVYFCQRYDPIAMHLYHYIVARQVVRQPYRVIAYQLRHRRLEIARAARRLESAGLIRIVAGRNNEAFTHLPVGSPGEPASSPGEPTIYIRSLYTDSNSKQRFREKDHKQRVSPLSEKGARPMPKKPTKFFQPHERKVLLGNARTVLNIRFMDNGEYARKALERAAQRLSEGYTFADLLAVLTETKRRIDHGMSYPRMKDLRFIWGSDFEGLLNERPHPKKTTAQQRGLGFRDGTELEQWKAGVRAQMDREEIDKRKTADEIRARKAQDRSH